MSGGLSDTRARWQVLAVSLKRGYGAVYPAQWTVELEGWQTEPPPLGDYLVAALAVHRVSSGQEISDEAVEAALTEFKRTARRPHLPDSHPDQPMLRLDAEDQIRLVLEAALPYLLERRGS